ncbi:MAG: hypothetical protein ACREGL_08805 [Alphaproteobacteria bacterium]
MFEAIARRTIKTSGAGINFVHKGEGPPLVLWSVRAAFGLHYDVLATCRERALDVRDRASSCADFLPEDAPEETLAELERFFAG